MRTWNHPATIIASLALFVALGGGTALAGGLGGLISGNKIVNHSIAENKLTAGAVRALRSHAFGAYTGDGTTTRLPANEGYVTVGKSLTLPAGSYVVIGKTFGTQPSGQFMSGLGVWCALQNKEGETIDFTHLPGSPQSQWSVSLVGTMKTDTGTAVTLKCESRGQEASAQEPHIVAIKVASATGRSW